MHPRRGHTGSLNAFLARLIEAPPRFVSGLARAPHGRRWALVLGCALEVAVVAPFALSPPTRWLGVPSAVALAVATAAALLVGTLEGMAVAEAGAITFATAVAHFDTGSVVSLAAWPLLVLLAGLFADRVASLRARLESELEQANERLRALVEAGIGLGSALDLDELLRLVVEAAPALTGAHAAALELVDGGARMRTIATGDGLPAGEGELAVPILLRGIAYGHLRLGPRSDGGAYGETERELLELLAAQAAVAIENRRLYEAASRWSRQLESLTQVSTSLAAEAELPALLPLVARSLRRLVDARTVGVYLPGPDRLLRAEAADGDEADAMLALEPLGPESKAWRVFDTGRAARVDSLLDDPDVSHVVARALAAESGLWLPLTAAGHVVGVLVAFDKAGADRRFTDEDARLGEVFAARAAASVQVARRAEEEALRKVVGAQEAERRRLALALHDGTAQELASILLQLRRDEPDLEQVRALLVETLREVRRLSVELHPKALDDYGLVPALERLTETVAEHAGVDVQLHAGIDGTRLGPEAETALFRIVQEALENVARHAEAEHASVLLVRRDGSVGAIVEDDGRGFDASADGWGLGLAGIRERVRLLGGTLTVESREGAGSTVAVEIPV